MLLVGGSAKTLLRRNEGIMVSRKWMNYEPATGDPVAARALLTRPTCCASQPKKRNLEGFAGGPRAAGRRFLTSRYAVLATGCSQHCCRLRGTR